MIETKAVVSAGCGWFVKWMQGERSVREGVGFRCASVPVKETPPSLGKGGFELKQEPSCSAAVVINSQLHHSRGNVHWIKQLVASERYRRSRCVSGLRKKSRAASATSAATCKFHVGYLEITMSPGLELVFVVGAVLLTWCLRMGDRALT